MSVITAAFAFSLHGAAPAVADSMGPVIVVPGRPGVPVIINGVDATGAVVYGDWGLARPGHGRIVIEGPVVYAAPPVAGAYYPATGHAPRYGRDEVEPPPHPRPPTAFRRSWSAESDMTRPVTEYPPFNPPPVIMAPQQRAPSGHK
jgi:hypothetical protein